MLTSTTNSIEGIQITETLGAITGLSANTKSIMRDIGSNVRNVFGGEMKANSNLMKEAQEKALGDLKEIATEMGADAITGLRYQTIKLDTGIGIYAYGTAVKIKKENGETSVEILEEINTGSAANDSGSSKEKIAA